MSPQDDDATGASHAVRTEAEHARIKEALEEERRILELLNQTGATLASNLDLERLVQAVTDAGTQLSGAQFGAFFYTVSNTQGDVFTLYTLSGAPREAFEKFGHPRATPVFAPTFRGEGVIRIADVRTDPRYGQMAPHFGMPPGHLPVHSYLAVPVIARSGEVIGGLFFGHRETNVFTERAERLIVGIAAQAAIAIDNARLYEETKRAAEERARLLDAERAARAEVERVSLMKDEFLATLSHELRTPLNAVLGWSEVLLSRSGAAAEVRRGLETITPRAGEIEVAARTTGGHVEINVRDSGVGIAPEFLPHVFERFRQADSSTTRRYGGLGLGLSIVKQLVELHGGSVRAASAGRGTTFTVELPLRAVPAVGSPVTDATPLRVPVVASATPTLHGATVLVVDDEEEDARTLLSAVLSDAGARVLSAESAAAALVCVKDERPAVVVSDIGMPERDGYQLMRDIRALAEEAGGSTPAIALTAFARDEDRARALAAGYQVHATKPIEAGTLIAAIAELLRA